MRGQLERVSLVAGRRVLARAVPVHVEGGRDRVGLHQYTLSFGSQRVNPTGVYDRVGPSGVRSASVCFIH